MISCNDTANNTALCQNSFWLDSEQKFMTLENVVEEDFW